jgi:hypothetical protein
MSPKSRNGFMHRGVESKKRKVGSRKYKAGCSFKSGGGSHFLFFTPGFKTSGSGFSLSTLYFLLHGNFIATPCGRAVVGRWAKLSTKTSTMHRPDSHVYDAVQNPRFYTTSSHNFVFTNHPFTHTYKTTLTDAIRLFSPSPTGLISTTTMYINNKNIGSHA